MRLEARRRDRIFELAARLEPTYRQYRVRSKACTACTHYKEIEK